MVKTVDVPHGHIADVITHLEMLQRPVIEKPDSPLMMTAWPAPDPKSYIKLFRAVGEPWLWLSRLLMSPEELSAIIRHKDVDLYRVKLDGKDIGFVELDFRVPGECEISFFGLVKEFNGQGYGKWLMARTLDHAWRDDINRVWLHTCTLDSPFALEFYQKCGFAAFKREVSIGKDPRLEGLFPAHAGPHIPLIS